LRTFSTVCGLFIPVLVFCNKKNLATLIMRHTKYRPHSSSCPRTLTVL
jgi:hypothetical protein